MPDCHRHFLACFFIVSFDVACSAQISDRKISTDGTGIGSKCDMKRAGQGLGTAAMKPVLPHALGAHPLRGISLGIITLDEREVALFGGEWHNDIKMRIVAREFSAPKHMLQGK